MTHRLVQTHELKCWSGSFEAVARGDKTWEWRRNDRGFALYDKLILREWDPAKRKYTGRAIMMWVSYIVNGIDVSPVWGIPPEYCIMSLRGDSTPFKFTRRMRESAMLPRRVDGELLQVIEKLQAIEKLHHRAPWRGIMVKPGSARIVRVGSRTRRKP